MFLELFANLFEQILFLAGYVTGNNSFPPSLSSEDEKMYLQLYKNGDLTAKNILIEHNLRLVAHIAKKYGNDSNMEDLISIGTIGLIKGINTFDFDKNKRLSTYISKCIENELLMQLRSDKKRRSDISIDESIGTDKDGNAMTFSDILPADNADIIDDICLKQDSKRLYIAMKKVLTPTELKIMCLRYGINNTQKKTQREIAQGLGISRSYVSRIEKKCLKKLRDEFNQ